MSVIQTLRDKYATVVVVVVCISLVAFLLMDAFVGPKSFFKQDTEVVTVNGVGYQYQDYMQAVQNEENMRRAANPQLRFTDQMRYQIRTDVYNKFVQDQILSEEYEVLGIAFSPDELRMLTVTADAAPQIKQVPGFQNPQTGAFDPNRVVSFIQNLRNAPANDQQAMIQRQQWMQMENFLQNSTQFTKFMSLITKGIYVPKWLAAEKAKEGSAFSNISFVSAPYTAVADSAIRVSQQELQQYLDAHSKSYQVEAGRSIEYVSFAAVPSPEDSAEILGNLKSLKSELDTIDQEGLSGFLTRNSETPYTDRFIPESMLQSAEKDALVALPDGEVFGPYFDNSFVVYAKKIASKEVADSIAVQQLLISNQQLPDSSARFLADSLLQVAQSGADFSGLVRQFAPGEQEGGALMITPQNPNIPDAFIQFVNTHGAGDIGLVQTQYGYHLIKINDKRNMETGYKIAYLTASMDPSQKTDNAIFAQANKFRGENGTRELFEKAAKTQGLNMEVANNIASTSFTINDLSSVRDIIYWAFNAEVGEVSKVFVLPDQYVVAVLTGSREKGTAPLESVRTEIEAIVRREKKAAQLAAKMQGSSLKDIAAAVADSVKVAQHISFETPFIPNSGFEPKVVGAAFNPSWTGGKVSAPVYGNNGVYVLSIDSIANGTVDSTALAQIQTQTHMQTQQVVNTQMLDVLTKEAEVVDRRTSFQGL